MSAPPPPPYGTSQPTAIAGAMPAYGYGQAGSPPRPSSLGTPHIPMWNQSGSGPRHGSRSGPRSGPRSGQFGGMPPPPQGGQDIVLVPTRPLLKALSRECKPNPPWCVGAGSAPVAMTQELHLFARFLLMTPQEKEKCDGLTKYVLQVVNTVWGPQAAIHPMGINAAGVYPPKESTLHFYSEGSADVENIEERIRSAANDLGFQADFQTDYRNCSTVLLTDARSGDRVALRYGPDATKAADTANLLSEKIAQQETHRVALIVIDALLRQNKVLDESGTATTGIVPEAIAVMLLAIANSYPDTDTPDAGRLLIDFFLTFGFPAHFDNAASSVSYKGMAQSPAKIHKDAQLSVLDPSDETSNLAAKADKIPHILGVFNYCYTALSQFTQAGATGHRAQSALSTIIGGETYWSRVLQLYHQKISPYYEVVRERAHVLAQMR